MYVEILNILLFINSTLHFSNQDEFIQGAKRKNN